jgi:rRNA-processing protein FCF1
MNFSHLIGGSVKRKLVLDTNLLILYLVGSYDPNRICNEKHTNIFNKEDYFLLRDFLQNFELVVTPNILTELANLMDTLNRKTEMRLFAYLGVLINRWAESYIPSKEIHNPAFVKFGLADSVIHKLAETGVIILTVDLPLYHYLAGLNLEAINFNHIRSELLLD